ncbi:T9SS type A sorting domain-containing protein [uncultured Spirosoma sp.]|uniref:T9SS type A sorting domain-containing protein n=1 Tax=uncultured Spirosoma sp. TaxID=278208 RepID=UPI0025903095|nr:T9SS type A sorting domain-containing protein [uncultured Spirosoma sp.]
MIRICTFIAACLCSTLALAQFEEPNRVLDRYYLPNRLEQATLNLTASNSVSSSQLTEYQAGKSVVLTAGFETRPSTLFAASIKKSGPGEGVSKLTVTTYPNPFVERTTITYQLADAGYATVSINDMNGKQISRPVDNQLQSAGRYELVWQADQLPSGAYICTLETGSKRVSTRIIRK